MSLVPGNGSCTSTVTFTKRLTHAGDSYRGTSARQNFGGGGGGEESELLPELVQLTDPSLKSLA